MGTAMEPTMNATKETFIVGNTTISAMAFGGHEAYRRIWGDFFYGINGIVFIVDAADTERFEESRQELQCLLENEMLQNIPILILGNKIDKYGAVSESSLRIDLGLNEFDLDNRGPLELFMVSITTRTNLQEAMNWFQHTI